MGHCKDCKHWTTENPRFSVISADTFSGWANMQSSHRLPVGFVGYCNKAEMADSDANTLAMALDHENYGAELWTHPEFGCVMFEGKG